MASEILVKQNSKINLFSLIFTNIICISNSVRKSLDLKIFFKLKIYNSFDKESKIIVNKIRDELLFYLQQAN